MIVHRALDSQNKRLLVSKRVSSIYQWVNPTTLYNAKHQIRRLSSQRNSKPTKFVDRRKQIKWRRRVHHKVSAMHGVLIISAWRKFPPDAPVAGSLIYIKARGMVGYAVSGWISRCVSNEMIATTRKQVRTMD